MFLLFLCMRLLSEMSTYIHISTYILFQNSVKNVTKSSSALGNSSARCLGLREVEIFLRNGKIDCHLHFSSSYHNAHGNVVLLLRARNSSDAPLRLQRCQRDKCASALPVKLPCARHTDLVPAGREELHPRAAPSGCRVQLLYFLSL